MRLTRVLNKAPQYKRPTPPSRTRKWNIVRGDKVQVVDKRHEEYQKQGIVLKVLRDLDRVIVQGVNVKNKHIKGDPDRGIKGRTIKQERTLPYSSVNLVDPTTGLPTKVVRTYLEDGTKVRISKRSNSVISRPDILSVRKSGIKAQATESCTAEEDVWSISYVLKE